MVWLPQVDNEDEPDYIHWSIDISSFKINEESFVSMSGQAIIDTGTSYMRVPASDFSRIKMVLEKRSSGELRNCVVNNVTGSSSCYCGFTESY